MELLAQLGRRTMGLLSYVGGLSSLLLQSLWWMTIGPLRGRGGIRRAESFYQGHRLALGSFGIVGLVIFFVGLILAFQAAYVLEIFGITEYVADMMGIVMVREMGPLLMAVVMTGFSGAAIAAEIGTMVVSEEVVALESSALHPVRFLVVPRLLPSILLMPAISLIATYIGVLGGFAMAWIFLDMTAIQFFDRAIDALAYSDVVAGLLKAEAFGVLITLIACYEGLKVTGGAEGVGKATTNSVVRSIVAIVICDLIFTTIFYFV